MTSPATICPECQYERPKRDLPPFAQAVEAPGTPHHADCPTILRLSPEAEEGLRRDLARIDDAHRAAMRDAHRYIIGSVAP